ncbi:TATA box-binding protein-associated factor RNA polymerase I subunit B-like isoform X2 [Dysidea avara]
MDKLKKNTNGGPSAKRRKIDEDTDKGKGSKILSLEFDPADELNLDITSESSSSSSEEETEEDVSIPGVFARSGANTKERTSISYLTLMSCVAVCYLGLLYAGETVLLVDIARWTRMNYIPYYQLRTSVLPDHITMTTADRRTFSPVHTLRPDRIYLHARKLYQGLSLPELPVADVLAIGKKLLSRLLLPVSFQGCLHKLLLIHQMDPSHGLSSRHLKGSERSEVECMAAIVVLLKMFYRLDDQYEVHQSRYVQSEHCTTSQEHGMFVWSDWVKMFSEYHNQKDTAGLLLTPEELLRTKDLKEYLEFCKMQVFGCNRKETKYSTFNKDATQELERIFSNFLNKTSTTDVSVTQSTSQSASLHCSGDNITNKERDTSLVVGCSFKPRIVPLNFSVPDFGKAYSSYCFHPVQFDFQELPRSYQYVLSVCSSLVEIDTKILFNCVKCFESQLNKQLRFVRNLQREYDQESVAGQQL